MKISCTPCSKRLWMMLNATVHPLIGADLFPPSYVNPCSLAKMRPLYPVLHACSS